MAFCLQDVKSRWPRRPAACSGRTEVERWWVPGSSQRAEHDFCQIPKWKGKMCPTVNKGDSSLRSLPPHDFRSKLSYHMSELISCNSARLWQFCQIYVEVVGFNSGDSFLQASTWALEKLWDLPFQTLSFSCCIDFPPWRPPFEEFIFLPNYVTIWWIFSPNANAESSRWFRKRYTQSALYVCFPGECADCVALFFLLCCCALKSHPLASPAVSLCFKYQSYRLSTAQ